MIKLGILSSSGSYKKTLKEVLEALERPVMSIITRGTIEDEPEYQLILESNHFIQKIDEEIGSTQEYISDLYDKKFPELDSLVSNRLDYIRAVQRHL